MTHRSNAHRTIYEQYFVISKNEQGLCTVRLDWIHWITSARQAKTRKKRINDACDMLAEGKKRVCCFDPSGFYSKALRAPKAAD